MAYSDLLKPEVLEPMIWKSLLAIEGQAAHLAPVNDGNLRNSITIATNSRQEQVGTVSVDIKSVPITPPSEDYTGVVGSGVEYAAAVEFGRPDMPNYPAQPFLRPALDWFRKKIGVISGAELRVQMAAYNIRHPHKVREYVMGGKK